MRLALARYMVLTCLHDWLLRMDINRQCACGSQVPCSWPTGVDISKPEGFAPSAWMQLRRRVLRLEALSHRSRAQEALPRRPQELLLGKRNLTCEPHRR